MQSLVEWLIRPLLNNPDALNISEDIKEDIVIYKVKISEEDMGKVIGKNGRVIRAIRTVANSSTKDSVKIELV